MRRWPIVPTIVVGLAMAAMIALGLWQLLDRRPKKLAYLAELSANPAKPPVAFPAVADQHLLFRRSTGRCPQPVGERLAGAGKAGYRVIVDCRTGAGRPDMTVQLGTTRDPSFRSGWTGGAVSGFISHAPDSRSLIDTLLHPAPQPLMLVADTPPAGLAANAPPDVSAVPNNHLAYAGQWFFFAAIAGVIYVLALRRRGR